MHIGHGQKREPFEFVASMINNTNFRNNAEQNAYLFNFDLQKHNDFIYIIIKVIIQPYPPQRLGEGLV